MVHQPNQKNRSHEPSSRQKSTHSSINLCYNTNNNHTQITNKKPPTKLKATQTTPNINPNLSNTVKIQKNHIQITSLNTSEIYRHRERASS
jgi:hypothetical protein